jgi:NitT/TauT family transport system substrate-binding protein
MNKSLIPIMLFTIFISALSLLRFNILSDDVKYQDSDIDKKYLKVGYLPVTCHLTCPVTDFASKSSGSNTVFESQRFSDFPTVASAFQTKKIQASFMLAPLAMKMREDGVPVKICYLGHRDGSQFVISKASTAKDLSDLKGSKIAIPSFYSNQHFVLLKLLENNGLANDYLTFVPIPPPDMPTALATGAIDGFFVGEPFCAKAEMDNIGRVLYYASDIWPNFISCVLVVHEDLIQSDPQLVRDLVKGIAESGAWAELHRKEASVIAANYYKQDPKLLDYVLTNSTRRVSYVKLKPSEKELQDIADIGLQTGLLKKKMAVSEILDVSFVPEHVLPATIKPGAYCKPSN